MPSGQRVSQVFEECGCKVVPLKVDRRTRNAMAAACAQCKPQ